MNIEEFLKKCKENHIEKYTYNNIEELNLNSNLKNIKLNITCECGNNFIQSAYLHVRGRGCKLCGYKRNIKKRSLTKEEFVEKAKLVHGNKYDYSLVNYLNSYTKVKIVCPVHDIFEQTPNSHLSGKGCKLCIKRNILSKEEFIEKAKLVHGNKYDYSLVNYINNKTKVKIICPKHGIFEQSPNLHISHKTGCRFCCESHGEREIANFLDKNKIKYLREYRFKECSDKIPLPFDFYLIDKNILIEFQGTQHNYPVKCWGGYEGLEIRKRHDKIKKEFAKNNNIKLIEIFAKDLRNLNDFFIKLI